MLDSDQEPSYNLSKNLLLLPRILKLMKDMVDDSTPLIKLEVFEAMKSDHSSLENPQNLLCFI